MATSTLTFQRFAIFSGACYYPSPPGDFKGTAEAPDQAIEAAKAHIREGGSLTYGCVIDLEEGHSIYSEHMDEHGQFASW